MSVKLLLSVFACIIWRELEVNGQSCDVQIYVPELLTALENLGDADEYDTPTMDGADGLFADLQSGGMVELVILMDNSLEVRPNHFNLVNKPAVETLLKYHVNSEMTSVSLIAFGEEEHMVVCKEIMGNCAQLMQCAAPLTYASDHQSGWIGQSLGRALDEAETIMNQTSKANRKKIILVVSGFQITSFYIQELLSKKQNITNNGVDIYTVMSSFRNKFVEGGSVASTTEMFMNDAMFVSKLYGFAPLGDKSCAGPPPRAQNNNQICKAINGNDICMCKLGYSGRNCDRPPNYCSFQTACPEASTCTIKGELRYTCSCAKCTGPEVCMNFEPNGMPPSPGGPPMPGNMPGGERPTGERPTGERPTGERPTGERPTGGERPSGERPIEGAFTPPPPREGGPPPSPPREGVPPTPSPPREGGPRPSPPPREGGARPPTPPREGRPPTPRPQEGGSPAPPRDLQPGQLPSVEGGGFPSIDVIYSLFTRLLETANACIFPNAQQNKVEG